ncbi:LppU/SCO3897 family protein [Amycolatopsis acidicola]|nr:hypothetical protein [Amycolatopsis acidicola]
MPGQGFPPPGPPGGFPPPGQPAGNFGPPPGAPIKPSNVKRWLRLGIGLVVVIGVGIAVIIGSTSSPDNAAEGDCLNVKEFRKGAEPDKVACTDPSANVKVGVRLDDDNGSCPSGDYDEYSVSGRSSGYKLCLMLNAQEGECVANVLSNTTAGYKRVDCADPTAEVKILKVVDGQADEGACDGTDADGALTYSKPPTTICASQTEGAA